MGCFELICCCGFGWLRVCHSSSPEKFFRGLQRKTLDPGFRRDDSFKAGGLKAVIPAQGEADVSERMRSARVCDERPPFQASTESGRGSN